MSSKPNNSMPQDRGPAQEDLTPDPLPPDVKIIECSCALAENRTSDNSKWVNIIREPIEVAKGSEIRVLSNYIDMRGIDQEIIQFQSDGPTQDNSHTLLTQLYTTNDGYNNKTCSYDYAQKDVPTALAFEVIDCGEGYGGSSTHTVTGYGGSGTGADCIIITNVDQGLRPKNITITSGGINYQNGETWNMTSLTDQITGFIQVNDQGAIVKLHITKHYSTDTTTGTPVIAINTSLGSGATISATLTSPAIRGGDASPIGTGLAGAFNDAIRGINYKPGDILTLEDNPIGGKIPVGNRASIRIKSIYSGPGALNSNSHFDQGYNYQKTPVSRWAQTFELSSAFCYGENTGTRTFTSHGQQVSIQDEASHQVNDKCLSASNLILNKEDCFAPGIYHKSGTNGDREFYLNKPVINFANTDRSTGIFRMKYNPNYYGGSWTMEMETGNGTLGINGNQVQINPFNIMPIGSVWQIIFEFESVPTPTILQEQQLSVFATNFASTVRVKELIQNQDTYSGTSKGTRVIFNNAITDYIGQISDFKLGTARSAAGIYPSSSQIYVSLVYNSSEDLGPAPPALQTIQAVFVTDATGVVIGSAHIPNVNRGIRRGMVFTIDQTQYPGAVEKLYITQVDGTGGWNIPAPLTSDITNNDLVTTAGDKLVMYIVPTLHHSNITQTISAKNKGNRLGFRSTADAAFIQDRFPLTLTDSYIKTTVATTPSNYVSSGISNGVYKPGGLLNSLSPYFETDQGALVNHDTEIDMEVVSSNAKFVSAQLDFSQDPATGVIVPFNDINDANTDWLLNPATSQLSLRINTANWNTAVTTVGFPLYTTVELSVDPTGRITSIQTGGVLNQDATYTYIDIISKDIKNSEYTLHKLSAATSTLTGLTRIEAQTPSGFYNNLNGSGAATLNVNWVYDIKNHNTQIGCKWNKMTGSIGITGEQNFFNINDPNQNVMANQPLYQVPELIKTSYNQGGYYFFTHVKGILSTQAGTSYPYELIPTDSVGVSLSGASATSTTAQDGGGVLIPNQFNQGYDFWVFGGLAPVFYKWRSDYQAPTPINYQQSTTNITTFWKYEPLYRQKFFSIDKSFCVASDISGIWTREAHKLSGAIDPVTGIEYVPSTETGILQNEFVMAIYGANNLISPSGEYIKDSEVYPETDGLEPGHSVGIQYVTSNTKWLAGDIMYNLPEDENGNKLYYVFFRTAFTRIRGYDPLKNNGGNPDFTPLATVSQDAGKIGNANALGSTTNKALNGDTMLATTNPVPAPTPPNPDNKGYELGEAGGVNAGGDPVRFGEKNYYPIYYLDEGSKSDYPRAKISQYIGSTNLTLAFSTDISTFTFQFLHQPYTSPFVDGTGGTNSIRVFFGNRKSGIFNHDTLGGVNVVNYCRPDFPRNTFTFTEITNNPTFINGQSGTLSNNSSTSAVKGQFIYGIDPLRSVGYVGRQFMNKLGFTDNDIGIINGQIATNNTQLGYKLTPYTRDITSLMDGTPTTTFTISSYDTTFYGTTGSDIDSSDSILSEIPAPETNAGLESHNVKITPNLGSSNVINQKFGDFIYYPYSLNTNTNSFQDTALVRYDNASSTYGAIGGLLLSNSNRGMGLPNTVGSTFIVDDSSIPVTLNPDCELYLAYTIACNSSLKQASILPQRLTNAYLVILSSLMKEANLYMPKAGFVNAMSIVSKTFLQGDFILSQGQLSFYAKEDFILSQIETEIKDTQFTAPSTLGVNSSVIYQITNYNPQPKKQLPTIEQEQEQDYSIMEAMSEHMNYLQGNAPTSGLNELNKDLYSLGLNVLTGGQQNLDIIGAIRNQIQTHDLPSLTPGERNRFLQTPEGQTLVQNATDLAVINSQIGSLAQAQNDVDEVYGGQQRLENITRTAQREIQIREQQIRERTPVQMFNQPAQDVLDFYSDLPTPQSNLIVQEPYTTKGDMKTFPSLMPELLDKVFTSKEAKEDAENKLREINQSISGIRKNVSPTKNPELRSKREQLLAERDTLLQSLTQDPMIEPSQVGVEKETPEQLARRMGRAAVRRAGYTPQDIAAMEQYGYKQKFGEAIDRRSRAYVSAQADSPFKPAYQPSDSGVGTSIASGEIVDDE